MYKDYTQSDSIPYKNPHYKLSHTQVTQQPTTSKYEIIVRMFCNVERVDMAIRVWDQILYIDQQLEL